MRCSICGADTYPDEVCPECSLTAQLTRALKQHALDRAEIERLEKARAEMQGELNRLTAELTKERGGAGTVARLRIQNRRMKPVYEAAKEWREDERNHTKDPNCQAGDHDDCPSRLSMPRLIAIIDAALAEKEPDRG